MKTKPINHTIIIIVNPSVNGCLYLFYPSVSGCIYLFIVVVLVVVLVLVVLLLDVFDTFTKTTSRYKNYWVQRSYILGTFILTITRYIHNLVQLQFIICMFISIRLQTTRFKYYSVQLQLKSDIFGKFLQRQLGTYITRYKYFL